MPSPLVQAMMNQSPDGDYMPLLRSALVRAQTVQDSPKLGSDFVEPQHIDWSPLLANMGDAITTAVATGKGAKEDNPLWRPLVDPKHRGRLPLWFGYNAGMGVANSIPMKWKDDHPDQALLAKILFSVLPGFIAGNNMGTIGAQDTFNANPARPLLPQGNTAYLRSRKM